MITIEPLKTVLQADEIEKNKLYVLSRTQLEQLSYTATANCFGNTYQRPMYFMCEEEVYMWFTGEYLLSINKHGEFVIINIGKSTYGQLDRHTYRHPRIIKNKNKYFINGIGAQSIAIDKDLNNFLNALEENGILGKEGEDNENVILEAKIVDDCEYVVYTGMDMRTHTKIIYKINNKIYFNGIRIYRFSISYAEINDNFFIASPGYEFINNDLTDGLDKFIKRNFDCVSEETTINHQNIYYDKGFSIQNFKTKLIINKVTNINSNKFTLFKKHMTVLPDFRYYIKSNSAVGKNFYNINENKDIINRYIRDYLLTA